MDDTLDLVLRALGTPGDRELLLQAEDDISCFLFQTPPDSREPRGERWWCCSCAGGCARRCASASAESPSSSGRPGATSRAPALSGTSTLRSTPEPGDGEGSWGHPGSRPTPSTTPSAALRTLEFPKLPSYHRLLIHATARRFGLQSSSFPVWAEEKSGALKSVHCSLRAGCQREAPWSAPTSSGTESADATGVKGVMRGPLLLYSDLFPVSSWPPEGSLVEKLEAEGYCSLGCRRLGVEPLTRAVPMTPVCECTAEEPKHPGEGRDAHAPVNEDRDTEGEAGAAASSAKAGPLPSTVEQRWLHDKFQPEEATLARGNAGMHRSHRPSGSKGASASTARPRCGEGEAPKSHLEEAKVVQGTGTVKRRGRGRFAYRREEEGEVAVPGGFDLASHGDEAIWPPGDSKGPDSMGGVCTAGSGEPLLQKAGGVAEQELADQAGAEHAETMPAQHDYRCWQRMPAETGESTQGSRGASLDRWDPSTAHQGIAGAAPDSSKGRARVHLVHQRRQDRLAGSQGSVGGAADPLAREVRGAGTSHIREVCIGPESRGALGTALARAGGTGCMECRLAKEIRGALPGCVCVRSTVSLGYEGDSQHFVAVFESKGAAERADTLSAAASGHRGVNGEQPEGCTADRRRANEDGGITILRVRSLAEADARTLHMCAWEIGMAGKRPRGSLIVDKGAASRLFSFAAKSGT